MLKRKLFIASNYYLKQKELVSTIETNSFFELFKKFNSNKMKKSMSIGYLKSRMTKLKETIFYKKSSGFNALKYFCFLIIMVLADSILGQVKLSGRNYFDSNWNLSDKYNYSYYRDAYKYSNDYYLIIDYFKNGTKQSETYTDNFDFSCGKHPIDCMAKEGYVIWYHLNGKIEKLHRFSSGLIISKEEWDYNGKKTFQIGCISGNCNSGYGTYVYSNGDSYTGYFSGGKRHGRGTYTSLSGGSIYGEFFNNISLEDIKTGFEILNEVIEFWNSISGD